MRITLTFVSDQPELKFSFNYHEHIQAMIYSHLPDARAEQLHEDGFPYEKRRFKLFTFSRINGRRIRHHVRDVLTFIPPIRVQIASPIDWVLPELADNILRKEYVRLGENKLILKSINVHMTPVFQNEVVIHMLSPMTTYSTLSLADGKKVTHYYTPFEKEFSRQLTENLRKKYFILNKQSSEGEVWIEPLFNKNREKIIKYRGTVIKAWDGKYRLSGAPELIHVAYETGLGSKNSQGFGMWEVSSAPRYKEENEDERLKTKD